MGWQVQSLTDTVCATFARLCCCSAPESCIPGRLLSSLRFRTVFLGAFARVRAEHSSVPRRRSENLHLLAQHEPALTFSDDRNPPRNGRTPGELQSTYYAASGRVRSARALKNGMLIRQPSDPWEHNFQLDGCAQSGKAPAGQVSTLIGTRPRDSGKTSEFGVSCGLTG